MPVERVRGIDLHYQIEEECESGGERTPPVVIAHGALGSIAHSEAFTGRASRLAARGFRVVSYDARGHGRTGYTLSREHYHFDELA